MKKLLFTLLLALSLPLLLSLPAGQAGAQTLSDLEIKIAAILAQIQTLQTELETLKTTEEASSASSVVFFTTLGKGSEGREVTALQRYLAKDPTLYPEGLVSGYYGALTEAAVKRFQAKHNIVSSGTPATTGYGVLGPKTRAILNTLLSTPLELTALSPIGPSYGSPTPTPTPVVSTTTPNRSPNLSITGDRFITLPNKATLSAIATDDGKPSATLTYLWSKAGGPGTVTFSAPTNKETTATFSSAGTYQITATVSDSDLFASYTVALIVSPASTTATTTAPATTTPTLPAPTLTFSANKTSLTKGNPTTLTWSSTNAISCSATQGWSGSKTATGSSTLTPTQTTTYTLSCKGGAGDTVAKSVTVAVTEPAPQPITAQKKFYPGFWGLYGQQNVGDLSVDASDLQGKEYFVGITRAYTWGQIEPAYGNYDFSVIRSQKEAAAAAGKKLGIEIKWTNNWSGGNPSTPSYMWNDASYGGTVPGKYGAYLGASSNDAWAPMTWNPKVQGRIFALLDAAGAAFDNDPDIGFILLEQETTHGATTADDPGYTCAKEIQAIKDILTYAYTRFPHTPVFYELDWTCTDTPSALHQFLIDGGNGAWTIDAPTCNKDLDANSFSLYRSAYDKIAGAIFLDGWNDVHGWPCYESAADILNAIGGLFRARYFLVDQSNGPYQAEINQAVGEWWNSHNKTWPLSDAPSAWK